MKSQSFEKSKLVNYGDINIIDLTEISNNPNSPIAFGKQNLFEAIKQSGGRINLTQEIGETFPNRSLIIGSLENETVAKFVSKNPEIQPNKPEGVFYQWQKTETGTALVIGGTDAKGLMYALNEFSERINVYGLEALSEVKNTVEYPENNVRGLDKFLTDQNDDTWFFSEDYWQYYLKNLANNRFNRLTLITGYNDGKQEDFMIPVYPYLFKIPGFEDVSIRENLNRTPQEYLDQLRRIGQLCDHYGLEFVFGIWGHGRSDGLVANLPEDVEAYTNYCSKGMHMLLREVKEIDGIQLRVNYESGVGGFGNTAELFWKAIIEAIGHAYKERNGQLFLDLRAKGLTEQIREWAIETGMNITVTSKYSWEGVGLPFHPTQMRHRELSNLDNIDLRQRYGYADFLNKSRNFDYINRLWGIGTIRLFTWADPDYVKRFSSTTSFGNAKGFQATPPMARKQNTWPLFNSDSLNYFTWEDQRYWSWYKLYGRLGYSTTTPSEVWERAFKTHYGDAFKEVLEAYSWSGKILPLITSSHLTFHPANYNWAEMDSGGALFVEHNANPYHIEKGRTYQSAEPGDPGLFYSIDDYVKDVLKNKVKRKVNPVQLAALYDSLSNNTLNALAKVNEADIPKENVIEFKTNTIDILVTAALAKYHSYKNKAATDVVFYQETEQHGYLKSSLKSLDNAKDSWKHIINLAGSLYNNSPKFLHDNGTWQDRLVEIDKDIAKLKTLLGADSEAINNKSHWNAFENANNQSQVNFKAVVPSLVPKNKPIQVTLITDTQLGTSQTPIVHYRVANMAAGKFKKLTMTWNGNNYIANIPSKDLNPEFDLLVYFTSIDNHGHVIMHPRLFHEQQLTPYYIVKIIE
ncbi:hypothetical protein E1J38_001325 [Seonamhaeicola sediminis]|uniref:Alpha glucuronidase N-terminal domain-containing protein n=1 Tax=Seonamhaeicola sediminis TaxID=2528206 RepID=A0A562YHL6_9FLAO|nr:hypothetical protein [Seonamhaeicola sediminis]TWO34523.1 hypothetical protein E1J38_001325 [Seonamhaeicola sediminis]